MYDASSDARNAIPFATSRAVPGRFSEAPLRRRRDGAGRSAELGDMTEAVVPFVYRLAVVAAQDLRDHLI